MDIISRHSVPAKTRASAENRETRWEHTVPFQMPQPKPEEPQEGALPDPNEEAEDPEELNADISLSAFFSPQTGQITSSEPALEE
jgi:hypothetical protein